MYLKKLEVNGFKTFAKHTYIEFNQEIKLTAIVGPNGCGKSNVFDAIRWVLGEQSMKMLRSSKAEEVIFNGTDTEKAVGMASVSLTLDNSKKMLPLDFPEVSIQRKLYRSGESEYFVNGQLCRLRDILDLFMDTGIGRSSYFMVGQGQVDQLISAKADERRAAFEEVAGIHKYQFRRQSAERKLQRTEENLTRLLDLQNELQSRLGPLKEQAEKAQAYISLRKELTQFEVGLFKEKALRLNRQQGDLKTQAQHIHARVQAEEARCAQLLGDEKNSRELLGDLEASIADIQLNLGRQMQDLAQWHKEKDVLAERLYGLQERQKLAQHDLQKTQGHHAEQAAQSATLEQAQAEARAQQSLAIQAVVILETALAELTQQWKTKIHAQETLRQNLMQHETELLHHEHGLVELRSAKQRFEESFQFCVLEVDKCLHEIQNLQSQMHDLENQKQASLKEQSEFLRLAEGQHAQLVENTAGLKQAAEERAHAKELLDISSSRLSLLEEMQHGLEGYIKGVKNLILAKRSQPEQFKQIHGVLADLLQVPEPYEAAIEAALGPHLQAVTTASLAAAEQALDFLKSADFGRVTFLPLDRISLPDAYIDAAALQGLPGVLGTALALIKFDPSLEKTATQLLHDILIVEDSAPVADLWQQPAVRTGIRAIITLSGTRYDKHGMVSGGSVHQGTANILTRHRQILELREAVSVHQAQFLEKERWLSDLRQARVVSEAELDHLRLQEQRRILLNAELESELRNLTLRQIDLQERRQNAQDKQAEIHRALEKLTSDLGHLTAAMQDCAVHKTETQASIAELLSQVSAIERAREIQVEQLTQKRIELTEIQTRAEQLAMQQSSLMQSLKQYASWIEAKQNELTLLGEQHGELESQQARVGAQIPPAEAIKTQSEGRLKEFLTQRQATQQTLEQIQNDVRLLDASQKQQNAALTQLEIELAKVESELAHMTAILAQEHESTLEDVLNLPDLTESLDEVEARVRRIRRDMKRLEPVNLLSIDEYNELKQRSEFNEKQMEDLTKAKRDLERLVQQLDQLARREFTSTLTEIQKHFSETFQELFEGGQARLLWPEEADILSCDIDVWVHPPGKKNTSLQLLSGGEKALTGIALLFALLKTRPAPFVLFDEIDAPLDDANVGRFTRALKKFTESTQMIIITHNKRTMAAAQTLYGVTMPQKGISSLVSVKLIEDGKIISEKKVS